MKKQFALSLVGAIAALSFAAPALAASISSQMSVGSRNADVTTLQQTLATDSSIYPQGLVTGYFGSMTAAAVSRFQAKYGLPQVGRVGPMTIAKFNEVYGGTASVGGAPIISNVTLAPNNSGMNVLWNTNQTATGVVYYSTSPLVVTEATGPGKAPNISGSGVMSMTTGAGTNNSLGLTNTTASTTYYYMIESIGPSGVSVTWPTTFKTN